MRLRHNSPSAYLLAILLLGDIAMLILHGWFGEQIGFFNLDKEQNLISLYTGIKFWAAASFAVVNAILVWGDKSKERFWWILSAVALLSIGLDDMFFLHERVTFAINKVFGLASQGASFNWLWFFSPVIAGGTAVFLWMGYTMLKRERVAGWLALAGLLSMLLAIAAEILGRQLILLPVIPVDFYLRLIIVEEGFELLGASSFTLAIFLYTQTNALLRLRLLQPQPKDIKI